MAENYAHTQPYDGMFRIICPGYHPGPGSMPGYGTAIITVVEGNERALVFDTGYGDPGLRSYIEKLTDRPLLVVISHSHPDHVGCNAEFDEVWIRPEEIANMERLCPSKTSDGVTRYVVRQIEDGQVFDVGGRSLEAVHIPGHAPGAIGLIDDKTRILLSGDSVLKRMLISQTRDVFMDALERLDKREFIDILGAHWPEPLGRAHVQRAIRLLKEYRPDMEVSAPWKMGGKQVEFRMFHRGTAFEDPEFVAFAYMSGISIG
jgi:glyoxylase-like metal-dependent hydrolase (beta-lactamase superfamily II)